MTTPPPEHQHVEDLESLPKEWGESGGTIDVAIMSRALMGNRWPLHLIEAYKIMKPEADFYVGHEAGLFDSRAQESRLEGLFRILFSDVGIVTGNRGPRYTVYKMRKDMPSRKVSEEFATQFLNFCLDETEMTIETIKERENELKERMNELEAWVVEPDGGSGNDGGGAAAAATTAATAATATAVAPVPMPPSSATKMTAFLNTLGLLEKCKDLADKAGIDEPGDFKMFTEDELVSQHMFKVGHVRKIFAALA